MVEVWFRWLKRDSYRLGLMDAHLNESCEKKAFNFGYLDIQAQATAIHPAIPWTPVTLFSLFKPYRLDDSHGVIPSGCRRRECADYVVDISICNYCSRVGIESTLLSVIVPQFLVSALLAPPVPTIANISRLGL